MRHLNQEQFEQHIKKFKDTFGVELYGTHAVVGDVVVPTVRTELMAKNRDGSDQYFMSAMVPGREGNLHHMTMTNFGNRNWYGLSLRSEHTGEDKNLDTYDLSEFSSGLHQHLSKAHDYPPTPPTIGMSLTDAYLDEWHGKSKLRAVEVSDWDTREGTTRVYDPVTQKYV